HYVLSCHFPLLKPGFCLDSVCQAIRASQVGHAADESAESFRPVRIGEKRAQNRAAEELSSGSDLGSDRKLAKPTCIQAVSAFGAVQASFKGQREMIGEEIFGPGAERDPLIPSVIRDAVFEALVNEDRHDSEFLIRLKEDLLGHEQPF